MDRMGPRVVYHVAKLIGEPLQTPHRLAALWAALGEA
jgi:hypothetical protein